MAKFTYSYMLTILMSALIILFILSYTPSFNMSYNEPMINIQTENKLNFGWSQNTCNYKMVNTMQKVLDDFNIQNVDNKKSDIIFPCAYDNINKEIDELKPEENPNAKFLLLKIQTS